MSSLQPLLSELLRPQCLDDLVLPLTLKRSFSRMIASKSLNNMIFYGAPGIGKTSAAHILLRDLDASAYRLNGSLSHGDKTMVRRIESFASTCSFFGEPKVCLIDEADYLSKDAQASLRYVIENSSENARFLMTANDIGRLSGPIQSRCTPICFDVSRRGAAGVIKDLIANYEARLTQLGYSFVPERLQQIVSVYFPDLRQIANRCHLEFYP